MDSPRQQQRKSQLLGHPLLRRRGQVRRPAYRVLIQQPRGRTPPLTHPSAPQPPGPPALQQCSILERTPRLHDQGQAAKARHRQLLNRGPWRRGPVGDRPLKSFLKQAPGKLGPRALVRKYLPRQPMTMPLLQLQIRRLCHHLQGRLGRNRIRF